MEGCAELREHPFLAGPDPVGNSSAVKDAACRFFDACAARTSIVIAVSQQVVLGKKLPQNASRWLTGVVTPI